MMYEKKAQNKQTLINSEDESDICDDDRYYIDVPSLVSVNRSSLAQTA